MLPPTTLQVLRNNEHQIRVCVSHMAPPVFVWMALVKSSARKMGLVKVESR